MRPFAFKHQQFLLEEICKNTIILPNYKFVNRSKLNFEAVLLYPDPIKELFLGGLGYKVYTDEFYDKNRLLFSSEELINWFVDDSKVKLDISFVLKSVYLMK
jgi:hypothetical protein